MKNSSVSVDIRQENAIDFPAVYSINSTAFDGSGEAQLVDRLRSSDTFIPELSLVATIDEKPIGYILFTPVDIIDNDKQEKSLALAPVAVLPEMQGQGVGSQLIKHGLDKAKELGYKSVVVLGHDHYYPRFGFEAANKWGIKAPFDVPSHLFMALELENDALSDVKGTVVYDKAFDEL